MNLVRLIGIYSRLMLAELLRTPAYVIPTVMFPAMFFCIFALPYARTAPIANFEVLSFIVFAIVGVTLFQFGVGIANERGRPWERYVRTLPAPMFVRLVARVNTALLFGLAAAGLVALIARIFSPVNLSLLQWILAGAYAILGAIPFVLFGIAIGYWFNARAALPIANIFYLLLSFAGGLWMPPQDLPGFAQAVSPYLPTRQFAELVWSVVSPGAALHSLAGLAAYSILFAILATIGYRRDERTRYA